MMSLGGLVVVFTGALSMNRADATSQAVAAGAKVGGSITAATTLLDVDERAAASLLSQLKRTAYNDAQALSDKEMHSSSPASGKALLGAELSLLRHALFIGFARLLQLAEAPDVSGDASAKGQ